MKQISQLVRLIHINFVLAKFGLDNVIVSIRLFAPLRFIIYFNPWNWFRKEKLTHGQAIRKAIEELGPIFVKFGQALSTRRDILPNDIANELAKLQDKVPPFCGKSAIKIIEQQFGKSIDEIFSSFDTTPLASASMAQVHAATLLNGTDVVVKILRPNMKKIIRRDVGLLYTIASLAEKYLEDGKRLKPRDIVKNFKHNLRDELDLMTEAGNASQLRRNFKNSSILYVPEVYWDYTREKVMVMERIYGIPISDIGQLKKHNINIKKLAERGVEIFFTQVFRDCFFHADMHPGNIFVSYEHGDDPQYICIDFGIIGTLSEQDMRYLAENLYAFFNRDYRRVAQLHVESGWVPRNTRVDEFETAIRTVCEPIFEKPLKDISFGQMILRLFQTGRRFHMEVQPQLILLQKTLFAIEGLGRHLYPDLDLWKTAKPFLERWMREKIGPQALLSNLKHNIPLWSEQLPQLPSLLYDVLQQTKDNQNKQAELELKNQMQNKDNQRYFTYGIGSTLLVSALFSWLFALNDSFDATSISVIAASLGLVALLVAWINR